MQLLLLSIKIVVRSTYTKFNYALSLALVALLTLLPILETALNEKEVFW